MKVFFNRVPKNQPWGGGNQFLIAMVHYLISMGHQVTYQLESNIDILFMLDPRPGDTGYSVDHIIAYRKSFPGSRIVHRVNECDKRKGTNFMDMLQLACFQYDDNVVFISKWLQDYYYCRGYKGASDVVYNGCNLEHFMPRDPCACNDTALKVVTHHWSNNWLKGFDIYAAIDRYLQQNLDAFEFSYIGRYNDRYVPRATNLIAPCCGAVLGAALRTHDVYVTASRWEPCGMHHIEAAASGLPVLYHAESGGINEKCVEHGLEFEDFESFLQALDKIKNNLSRFQQKINYKSLDVNYCCEQFYKIMKRVEEEIHAC